MSYTHLTERERYVISHLNTSGISKREIGRRLNRSHTTISRELARNSLALSRYWYIFSQPMADARKPIPRHTKRESNKRLMKTKGVRLNFPRLTGHIN